jgi:hypothetical protein
MPYDLHAENSNYLGWELDPSTRQNTHIWTKWAPVDVTLTTAGTAQTLFSASTERPTVNIATNPSFETGTPPTGYTAVGATLAQSSTVAYTATNSMSVDPDNSAAGEGFYWDTPVLAGRADSNNAFWLVASAYFQDNADVGRTARIEIRDAAGTTTHISGNEITLSSSWQRSIAAFQLPIAGVAYRIYFVTSTSASDEVFYVDGFQLELKHSSTATTYCDGAQGLNYEWDSTAHASTSRRRIGLVSIRGYHLYVTRNCYLAFDHTASSTLGRRILAGTDIWTDFPIEADSISFINENSGELPRIFGEILGVHQGAKT